VSLDEIARAARECARKEADVKMHAEAKDYRMTLAIVARESSIPPSPQAST
jgi:hypothetical protein